ncbi:MAG: type II toxin-antitoxin system RelB/DinJ family antitoxin [Oscillospiraceae bacterium]|nr:type II toxin-antitoxin system RelB/DinJ family antitoxin [Oscillospiraceae bacterium]
MAKDATVSARVDYAVKTQAEEILQGLGLPVSVVIDALYHQIIYTRGIPFPLTLPREPRTMDSMSKADIDAMLQHSYEQSLAGQGRPFDQVFDEIERSIP